MSGVCPVPADGIDRILSSLETIHRDIGGLSAKVDALHRRQDESDRERALLHERVSAVKDELSKHLREEALLRQTFLDLKKQVEDEIGPAAADWARTKSAGRFALLGIMIGTGAVGGGVDALIKTLIGGGGVP